MKPLVPGTYVMMQPYLAGGGQVRLRCRACWYEFDIDVPKLPNPEHKDTLRGKCPRCNTEDRYGPPTQARRARTPKHRTLAPSDRRPTTDGPGLFELVLCRG